MKLCSRCLKKLAAKKFAKKKDGLQPFCRKCQKIYHRAYYLKNKTKYLAKAKKHHYEIVKLIRDRKTRPCEDCGGSFHFSAMQYDHRPGSKKIFNLANGAFRSGIHAIEDEISKCDIVCANCHALRTFNRKQPRSRVVQRLVHPPLKRRTSVRS